MWYGVEPSNWVVFLQEREVKTDEGERMKTNQRNVNSCLRKMAKVGDNKFVFLVISKFPHNNIPLLNHLLF